MPTTIYKNMANSPTRFKDTIQNIDETLFTDTHVRALAWECLKEYWYYAEIGFDLEEIFIQRLQSAFNRITPKYEPIFESVAETLFKRLHSEEYTESGTTTPDLTESETVTHSGDDKTVFSESRSGNASHQSENTETYEDRETKTTAETEVEESGTKTGSLEESDTQSARAIQVATGSKTVSTSETDSRSGKTDTEVTEDTTGSKTSTGTGTDTESGENSGESTLTHGEKITYSRGKTGSETRSTNYARSLQETGVTPEEFAIYLGTVPVRTAYCHEFASLFMQII